MADQRVDNDGQKRAAGASPSHQKITPKRPGFRSRTRAYASSRLGRLIQQCGDSTTAHNGAISMISMCRKMQIDLLMRRVQSDRQEPRHECTHYRLLESRAARAVGNDQLLRLRLLRSSCPAPAAPPGCRRGSITVEDLEQADPSIDGRLGWLSSQPLELCAPLGRELSVEKGKGTWR